MLKPTWLKRSYLNYQNTELMFCSTRDIFAVCIICQSSFLLPPHQLLWEGIRSEEDDHTKSIFILRTSKIYKEMDPIYPHNWDSKKDSGISLKDTMDTRKVDSKHEETANPRSWFAWWGHRFRICDCNLVLCYYIIWWYGVQSTAGV